MSAPQTVDQHLDANSTANLDAEQPRSLASPPHDQITPAKDIEAEAGHGQATQEKGGLPMGDTASENVGNGLDHGDAREQGSFEPSEHIDQPTVPERTEARSVPASTAQQTNAAEEDNVNGKRRSNNTAHGTATSVHSDQNKSTSTPIAASQTSVVTPGEPLEAPSPPPKDDTVPHKMSLPLRPSHISDKGKSAAVNSSEEPSTKLRVDTEQQQSREQVPSDVADESRSEIQSIMEQFDEGMSAPGVTEIMSPRLDLAGSSLSSPMSHPPRKSSLEPLQTEELGNFSQESGPAPHSFKSPPPRTSSLGASPSHPDDCTHRSDSITSPKTQSHPIFKPPPLEPDSEPDLPFDFHRFLEQLRHKTADPVARFLRSFLNEFGKKHWMVHEQVKIISDFLEFISRKMAQCEVWRTVSDAEFDNAKEGMEKLVMNRLYSQTFSPEIPAAEPTGNKNRRHRGPPSPDLPGRRGQHQEDVERDNVLAQKVRIYSWVKEEQLDIPSLGDKGRKFLALAQQELSKINSYRAPRDKVICILNCCKVIFGFLRNQKTDQSADSFVPILIFTVLQANPGHLVSNVQYILRFRNQDKLGGEAGYYISSLMGAVQFIENLDRTSLTISDEEFEKNVEASVSAIAERHHEQDSALAPMAGGEASAQQRRTSPHMHLSEKSAPSRAEVTARNSLEAERAAPRRAGSGRVPQAQGPVSSSPEDDAVTGLLKTIQKPLSTIGRIFSDDNTSVSHQPATTPKPGSTPRRSPAERQRSARDEARPQQQQQTASHTQQVQQLNAADAAARQASAEAEEARKLQIQEHKVVVETLAGMFPTLDRDVIDDVVRMKEGRVGLAVDACLALTNTS